MLQIQDLRMSQEIEPYIRVNTREFDGVFGIKLFILYMLDY